LELLDCPCAGATLDKLVQPAVLAVLAQGPLHGYSLAERVGAMRIMGGQKPDVSGIYRYLKAMEARVYVTSTWDLSSSGPARKRYHITPAGLRCLAQWVETLDEYRQGISELLRTARKALPEA
jgi:DNA-binding PadR family transcriptional regulator